MSVSSSTMKVHDGLLVGKEKEKGSDKKKSLRSDKTKDILKRIFMILLHFVGLIPISFFFGIRSERSRVQQAKSTHSNYSSSSLCAYNTANNNFHTLGSYQEANDEHDFLHCGECGQCSNDVDIDLMIATKDTLTKDATKCALKGLIFGEQKVDGCLQDIGFTSECSTCWKNNIKCTTSNCMFTCLKTKLFAEPNNIKAHDDNDGGGGAYELNECLECDEKMCGTEFIQCAGANRRRLGIVSDIARHEDEQCRTDFVQ